MLLTRPDLPDEPSRFPLWLRRAIWLGALACLAVALAGFLIFALRAVTFH
jgi:hypothetical protein